MVRTSSRRLTGVAFAFPLMLALIGGQAWAQDAIGSITKVDPSATIETKGATTPAVIDITSKVSMADIVRTDVNGFVKIQFRDGSELTVNPGSNVTIDEYVYDPSTNGGKLVMSVGVGVARFVSGNMKKDNIKIKTPTATMGLRGTDIVIRTDGIGSEIEVLAGGITLTPCDLKDVVYTADAGDIIGVDFSCAVSTGPAGVSGGASASASASAGPGPSDPGDPGDPGGPSGGPGNGNGNTGNSGNGGGNTGGSGPGTGNGGNGTGNGGGGGGGNGGR
jgi:hypothetical protein